MGRSPIACRMYGPQPGSCRLSLLQAVVSRDNDHWLSSLILFDSDDDCQLITRHEPLYCAGPTPFDARSGTFNNHTFTQHIEYLGRRDPACPHPGLSVHSPLHTGRILCRIANDLEGPRLGKPPTERLFPSSPSTRNNYQSIIIIMDCCRKGNFQRGELFEGKNSRARVAPPTDRLIGRPHLPGVGPARYSFALRCSGALSGGLTGITASRKIEACMKWEKFSQFSGPTDVLVSSNSSGTVVPHEFRCSRGWPPGQNLGGSSRAA